SPIPLTATFRNVPCISANAVSKSILRVAVDELYREISPADPALFYFPSYDVIMYLFRNAWELDRRHVRPKFLDFNMMIFERYFCQSDVGDAALLEAFRDVRQLDERIGRLGADKKRRVVFEERVQLKADI